MEPESRTEKEQSEIIDLVEEADDAEYGHVLCLPDKKDRLGLFYSSLLSALFHVAVYAALAYAAVTYPVIYAPSEHVTLWYYPSLQAESKQAADKEEAADAVKSESSANEQIERHKPEPVAPPEMQSKVLLQQPPAEDEINIYTAAAKPIKAIKPVPQKRHKPIRRLAKPVVSVPEQPPMVTPEKAEQPKADSLPPPEPEASPLQTSVAEKQAEATVVKEELTTEKPLEPAASKEKVAVALPAKPVFKSNSAKTSVKAPVVAAVSPAIPLPKAPIQPVSTIPKVAKKEPPKVAAGEAAAPAAYKVIAVMKKKTAAVARKTIQPAKLPTAATGTTSALPSPKASPAREGAISSIAAISSKAVRQTAISNSKKTIVKADKSPEKKPKGIFIPPLPGDLKFEINSNEGMQRGVKVNVLFREFPKSMRKRGLSKSESKQIRRADTKVVLTGPNTIQAVVEHTAEGVYYLRIELERKDSMVGNITIRLHEPGPKTRIRKLAKQTINSSETIVRILMPEGTLWDDQSAFSGSMEDSDSVTRYNNDTGLVWKEYH